MSPTTQCWAPPLLQFLSLGLSVPAWLMPVFLSSLLPGQSHSVTFPAGPDKSSSMEDRQNTIQEKVTFSLYSFYM